MEGILGSNLSKCPLSGQKTEGQLFSPLLGDVSMLAEGFPGIPAPLIYLSALLMLPRLQFTLCCLQT